MNHVPANDHEAGYDLLEKTALIVASYVSHNAVSGEALPDLIASTGKALRRLEQPEPDAPAELRPAVSVRASIKPDHLVCLEDGKKFKSLKRHLESHHHLTPAQYRERWNLPADYPMVSPEYSEQRSGLAKASGLGRKAVAARRGKAR